jgi:hypothetical protein
MTGFGSKTLRGANSFGMMVWQRAADHLCQHVSRVGMAVPVVGNAQRILRPVDKNGDAAACNGPYGVGSRTNGATARDHDRSAPSAIVRRPDAIRAAPGPFRRSQVRSYYRGEAQ